MYILGCGVEKKRNIEDIKKIFLLLKKHLKHGSIILTSTFQNYSALISPTVIKHSAFCSIEDDNYYIYELANNSKLKKKTMYDFLRKKDTVFLFNYFDLEIMNRSLNYLQAYKDCEYGFFGKSEYCYKLIFNIYRDLYKKEYKKEYEKMSDFFPVVNFFGLEYVNANSIIKSKKFKPTCCFIKNIFIEFKY